MDSETIELTTEEEVTTIETPITTTTMEEEVKKERALKNFTEIASDEELSALVGEFFNDEENNLMSSIGVNLQGYHNTSNLTEDRAPEP